MSDERATPQAAHADSQKPRGRGRLRLEWNWRLPRSFLPHRVIRAIRRIGSALKPRPEAMDHLRSVAEENILEAWAPGGRLARPHRCCGVAHVALTLAPGTTC